jgi:carboxypeptidase Q
MTVPLRKLLTSFVLMLVVTLPAAAQFGQPQSSKSVFPPQDLADMKRLQQAALSDDYAWNQLAHLTDNIGPRPAGSAQAQAAAEYVAAEMRKLGLEVTLEKCTVPHWVRGRETGELVEFPGMAAGTAQKVVLTALGNSVATPPEGITADVIAVRNMEELQALGREKVQGKIVVFNYPYDEQLAQQGMAGPAYGQSVLYRVAGASAAARLGAVAALNRSAGGADYRLPHTGMMQYAEGVNKIPAGSIAAEDAALVDRLARQGRVRMHLVLTPQTLEPATSYNVIADLKGSEHPEQVVIVSGHLDSWDLGTGAIDDGAGVVVSMETVKAIKQLGLVPKRTIRFIAWMDEELGGSGGRQYAADHATDMANQFAAIETDLGAGHAVGINANGPAELQALLRPIGNLLASQGASLVQAGGGGSDIGPLMQKGVPGFSPIQDVRTYFHYHHTAADTLDKVNPQFLRENSAVIAVLAYALATVPQDLPHNPAGPVRE